jgi:hypothetical protein
MSTIMSTQRPDPSEYMSYFGRYIDLVPTGPLVELLAQQFDEYLSFYRGISDAQGTYRYAPDKWSIKQVLGHMVDTERIFNYRALCVSRGEQQSLPGFEQDDYVAGANFEDRRVSDLVDELASVRAATVWLFKGLSDEALSRRGIANKGEITARACGYIIAGHERYHVKHLQERYLATS